MPRWAQSDIDFLTDYGAGASAEELARALPGHSADEVRRMLAKIELRAKPAKRTLIEVTSRYWNPSEDMAIRTHYPEHGPSWSGWRRYLPWRTRSAILSRAQKLGVKYEGGE